MGKACRQRNLPPTVALQALLRLPGDRNVMTRPCFKDVHSVSPNANEALGYGVWSFINSNPFPCGQQEGFTHPHGFSISTLILKTHPNVEWISQKKTQQSWFSSIPTPLQAPSYSITPGIRVSNQANLQQFSFIICYMRVTEMGVAFQEGPCISEDSFYYGSLYSDNHECQG